VARGWESKSVESQIEDASSREAEAPKLTPEEKARRLLELSRTRVLHDLERATNPRYRAQLEAALAHLNAKLRSG
jgi:hypothetical protein